MVGLPGDHRQGCMREQLHEPTLLLPLLAMPHTQMCYLAKEQQSSRLYVTTNPGKFRLYVNAFCLVNVANLLLAQRLVRRACVHLTKVVPHGVLSKQHQIGNRSGV